LKIIANTVDVGVALKTSYTNSDTINIHHGAFGRADGSDLVPSGHNWVNRINAAIKVQRERCSVGRREIVPGSKSADSQRNNNLVIAIKATKESAKPCGGDAINPNGQRPLRAQRYPRHADGDEAI